MSEPTSYQGSWAQPSVGGLISGGLVSLGNIGSVTSWRLIFLVEGIITIVVAFVLVLLFPSDPTTTRLFSVEQRELAKARILADSPVGAVDREAIAWPAIKQSFMNLNMAGYCFIYIASKSELDQCL